MQRNTVSALVFTGIRPTDLVSERGRFVPKRGRRLSLVSVDGRDQQMGAALPWVLG